MNRKLFALLAGALAVCLSSCIYVRVKGNLSESGLFDGDDDDLARLTCDLEDSLGDSSYDLDVYANLWRTDAVWTVRYAEGNADKAFQSAKEAVLRRIDKEGGHVTTSRENGPQDWTCAFELDDEPGEASVRILADEVGSEQPQRLEIRWKESNWRPDEAGAGVAPCAQYPRNA